MTRSFEFFFDFGSPTTYLAYTQLQQIATARDAEVVWRPMLLGGVFKASGNASPVTVPAKGRWMLGDMALWAKRYGVPFRMNPAFPVNTLALMRGAAGLQLRHSQDFRAYVDAIFSAMWVEPRNLNDAAEVEAVLREGGFDPAQFAAMIADAEVKEALKRNTEEAVARGVFGAPTFFVNGQMYFGQDRLTFVAEALEASC